MGDRCVEGGFGIGGALRGSAKLVAEIQRECYHNSTVPVKEYLEVIEKMRDPSLRSGQVGDRREKIGK
jgi:hypothetical protein